MEEKSQSFSRGKLIRSVRTTLHVPIEETIAGLCSSSAFGTYERGEKEPGKWVSDMLLERLGQVSDQFSCMYYKTEIEECLYRDMQMYFLQKRCGQIFWALWQESWEMLKKERFSNEKDREWEQKNNPEKNCQEQFLRGARVLACYYKNGEHMAEPAIKTPEEMAAEMERALRLTLPEEGVRQVKGFRLGRIEITLKALQADIFCQKKETREKGLFFYRKLLEKVKKQFSDPKAVYYQYQYLAALYLKRLALAGKTPQTALCQECWLMIKEGKKLYGLETLLCYEKEYGLEGRQKEKRADVLRLLAALENWQWEVVRKEGEEKKEDRGYVDWKEGQLDDFIELLRPSFRGLPLGESVLAMRKQKKLSREKLGNATNITTKTIQRLEQGEVDSSLYIYQKILKALGRDGYRYSTDIMSNELAVHEQYQKINKLISYWEYEEARKEVEDFVKELYRKEPVNQQCIEMLQTILAGQFKEITREEELNRLRAALALTVPEEADLAAWPLGYQEIALINNIANAREALGEFQEAEKILNQIVKNCEHNPAGVDKNAPQYLLSLYNLERYLGNQGKYEEGSAISKKGLWLGYRVKDGASVVEFLYKLAWNKEQIYDQEAKKREEGEDYEAARESREQKKKVCLPICRQTLALAELLDYTFYVEHIQKHCQKEYGIDTLF